MTVDRSPLAGFTELLAAASSGRHGSLRLFEESQWQQLNVRISPDDADKMTAVLGGALPLRPNTVTSAESGLLVWLGPDEWLVLSPDPRPHLETALRAAAGSTPVSVVVVSAARTVLSLGGSAVRDVLAHGCGLDLDARVFVPGTCAQTRLALANVVLIAPPDQPDGFATDPQLLVLVRSSFAPYLATWLLDAAIEYTAVVTAP